MSLTFELLGPVRYRALPKVEAFPSSPGFRTKRRRKEEVAPFLSALLLELWYLICMIPRSKSPFYPIGPFLWRT